MSPGPAAGRPGGVTKDSGRLSDSTPWTPRTHLGHLQTLPEDNRTHLRTAQTLQVLSGTSPDPSGWLQDPPDPHEHTLDTPRHSWDIFRPFQKTTEPTQGPPRHSKSSLKHPQTLLDDCKDALGTPGDPLDPTRSFLDISRRFWMNLRTPMDQQEDPLDPPRPFWDISRPFWMAPGPPRPT